MSVMYNLIKLSALNEHKTFPLVPKLAKQYDGVYGEAAAAAAAA